MKKCITKISVVLLVVFMCATGYFAPVYASVEDEAMNYTLGETYHGSGDYEDSYRFTLSRKCHVTFNMTMYGSVYYDYIELLNSSGRTVFYGNNIPWSYNSVRNIAKGRVSRTLPAGTYYFKIKTYHNYESREYDFKFQAEPLITFPRGAITSLKCKKAGQATVVCKAAPNAIGYRIQYSTDYRFRKGVKTVYSPLRTKTLTKLAKGKRYYIKVCPYTVYDDGEHAMGMNSYVKSVYVRKR